MSVKKFLELTMENFELLNKGLGIAGIRYDDTFKECC